MPTLMVIDGAKIQMFHEDHPPPHFHIYKAGKSYRFMLANYEQFSGDSTAAPKEIALLARTVGARYAEQLKLAWTACRLGEQPCGLD